MSGDASFMPESPRAAPQHLQFAGFWRRVAASVVDALVLVFPTLLVWYAVDPNFFTYVVDDPAYQPPLAVTVIFGLMGWLYWAGMESSQHQASLGKKAIGLMVTDLSGRRLDFATASRRAWPFYLGAIAALLDRLLGLGFLEILASLVVLVSCLAVAFTKRKQGFHDMMAGCLVVRRPPALGPVVRA